MVLSKATDRVFVNFLPRRPLTMSPRALLPSAVTLSSVVAATIAALVLVVAPRSAPRDVVIAACLSWSLLADRLDGALARRLGVTSSMGAQLDSLADATAFGVVPALWIAGRHDPSLPILVAAVVYVVAAVVRLARFASVGLQPSRLGPSFHGLPSPAAAAVVVVVVAVDALAFGGTSAAVSLIEAAVVVVVAGLMLAPFPYPKHGVGFVPFAVLVPLALLALFFVASGVAP